MTQPARSEPYAITQDDAELYHSVPRAQLATEIYCHR